MSNQNMIKKMRQTMLKKTWKKIYALRENWRE